MRADILLDNAKADVNAAIPMPAFPPLPTVDNGRVRLGGQAPLFQPLVANDGQVSLGGHAPLFLPSIIADAGLVRLGGQSPTF